MCLCPYGWAKWDSFTKQEFGEDHPAKGGVVFLCLNPLSAINCLLFLEANSKKERREK
jgi:hypothetical protein